MENRRSPSPTKSHQQQHPPAPTRSRTSSLASSTSNSYPVAPSTPSKGIKVQPNAHPYAIKTTSTALLSHTTSSPHHGSVYQHYVPPPSPSPTGSSGPSSPTQLRGGSRHRYSRSLTDEVPRLPAPPRAGSVSPRKAFAELQSDGDDDDADDGQKRREWRTPRQSGLMKRAETLPSFSFPPQQLTGNSTYDELDGRATFRDMELPDDPKAWTPAQLAAYLEQRVGGEHGGAIAQFVRERGVSGRGFLKIGEREIEEYNIPLDTARTLLTASRSLRQSALRGRIWGFGPAQDTQPRSRSNSMSSSSSPSEDEFASNSRHVRRGSRVKEMAASFERSASSGSEHELDGPGLERAGSRSPTKRALPQRGRVNDLFSPLPPPPTSASPTRDAADLGEVTVKGHPPPPNRNKELPRLLPFPPTTIHQAPVAMPIVPVHTGAGYPLPASPDHSLYGQELGYRASPSIKSNGQAKPVRLLPIPPPLAASPAPLVQQPVEQVLHHPRPVRGGPPELVSVDAISKDEGGDGELSVEELLKRGEGPRGVEAWEVGVGETVKRIVSGPVPGTENMEEEKKDEGDGDKTVEGIDVSGLSPGKSFVMGRTGRRGRRVKPKTSREGADASPGKALGGLFEPPKKVGVDAGSQTDGDESEVEVGSNAKEELEKLEKERAVLEEEKRALKDRAVELTARKARLIEREREVEKREEAVDAKERVVVEREGEVAKLEARAAALSAREEDVEKRLAEVKQREEAIAARDLEQDESVVALAARLLKKVVGKVAVPVFGERVAGYLMRPLGVDGEEYLQANGDGAPNPNNRRQAPRPYWLPGFLNGLDLRARGAGAPYVVLLGLGVCAVILRVVMKRAVGVGAVRAAGRGVARIRR